MKTVLNSALKLFLLAWISIQVSVAQPNSKPVLAINQNPLWRSMLEQWFIVKYTSPINSKQKVTLKNPALNVNLSMQDLIEQTNQIIAKKFSNTNYVSLLTIQDPIQNFDHWYAKLNELAVQDSYLKKQLDQHLILQQYNQDGVALTQDIGMLKLARIHKIEKYNNIALDPEGPGILSRLGKNSPLTVITANQLSKSEIEFAKNEQYTQYYQEMLNLEAMDHQKYGGDTRFYPVLHAPRKNGHPMYVSMHGDKEVTREQDSRRRADERFFKLIFNALEKLPEKHSFIQSIDEEMNHSLPHLKDGTPVLTPSFIQEFEPKLTLILKDLTWKKQLSNEDDETLFLFRKWIKKHREEIKLKLENTHQTLAWINDRGLPHRSDVIESYEILCSLYNNEEPWQDEISTIMRNKRGNEVVVGRTIVGSMIRKTSIFMKNLVKSENLIGVAAGSAAFILTSGNLAIAMTANSVTHDVISNRKYDHAPRELLTQIPLDILSGALTQSAFQPGRIFNVIALGAGSGLIQGITTKQDPLKSAMVGAAFETGLEFLPANIKYPLVSGTTKNTLRKNAAIEIFTTSAKTTLRGGVVAILEKKDVVKGMEKGAIYGATTAILKIVVLGVRYDPLAGQDASEIRTSIEEENTYDNANGAPGGNYQITENTIQKTSYRTGGWLPIKLDGSIALPGNVSMNEFQIDDIDVIVHEAHHLSQQEQIGLLKFYIQYIYEGLTTPYTEISFEISPH